MIFKEKLEDYTEAEFLEFLNAFVSNPENLEGKEYGKYIDRLVNHFERVTEHPAGSDVIFYPDEGCEDTPESKLKVIKEWRAENGKPGFREPH